MGKPNKEIRREEKSVTGTNRLTDRT